MKVNEVITQDVNKQKSPRDIHKEAAEVFKYD